MGGRPAKSEYADHWGLDPEITFLNHGSFGACPTAVLEYQTELRKRLESEPVRFFGHECVPLWQEARGERGELEARRRDRGGGPGPLAGRSGRAR